MVTRQSLVDLLLESQPSEEIRDLAMAIIAIDRRAPKTHCHAGDGEGADARDLTNNSTPDQTSGPTPTDEATHNGTPIHNSEPTPTDEATHNGTPIHNSEPTPTDEATHNGTPIQNAQPSSGGETTRVRDVTPPSAADSRESAARTSPTRRALAITALGGLLIAGVAVVATSGSAPTHGPTNHGGTAIGGVHGGDCLSWPKSEADQAHIVDCTDEHLFEVAQSVDMSAAQQDCQVAVQGYLGNRYDPNGKFAIGAVPAGNGAASSSAGQHRLCGLLLPGSDKQPVAFKGRIADLDQSRIWPSGTCLAVDPTVDQADAPVGCSAPHAEEVTGVVNLAQVWPDTQPSQPDQDQFLRDACGRATDAYLSPVALETTGLTLMYSTVPPGSWLAGSRQMACGIGAPQGDRGWATLTGSAKDHVLVNGVLINGAVPSARPAVPSPEAPGQRPDTPSPAESSRRPAPSATAGVLPGPAASASATPSPVPPANPSPVPPANPSPVPPPNPSPEPPANPSPSPSATSDPDAGQVIEIPGLAPITLPRLLPPAPPSPGD